jgi:signal transduction histidine kinase
LSTPAQIRLLLAVVCATFLLTAAIVKQTFTPKVNLEQTGTILQNNLNQKEAYVNQLLADKIAFAQLKHIGNTPAKATNFIQDFTTDRHIWFATYTNNRLAFWSGIKILPDSASNFKEGASFVKQFNGYYEVIKKTDGSFSALFFIPVKATYRFQNRYLHNNFDKDILNDDNVDIAAITDKQVYNVHTANNTYLFSLKLRPGGINHRFFYFEAVLWLLGFITMFVLVHKSCNYMAIKGYVYASFGALAAFICLVRFISLYCRWPDLSYFDLFNKAAYSGGVLFPSLGDFCINMLAFTWLGAFVYYHRHLIVKGRVAGFAAYLVVFFCSALLAGIGAVLLNLYYNLVINSNINFDVTNVFNLSGFSLLGVLMLCFAFLFFYFINDALLIVVRRTDIPDGHKAAIFAAVILMATVGTALTGSFSAFYLLLAAFTIIRAYAFWKGDGQVNAAAFLSLIAVCSLISALKLNSFQIIKETKARQAIIKKLEVANDDIAEAAFSKIEKAIMEDRQPQNYFIGPNRNSPFLKNYLQKTYFDGYLNKYELKLYAFDADGLPITDNKKYLLNDFKDMVAYSALKVSGYFYHDNNDFGFQSYFAILPFFKNGKNQGTIVISLRAVPMQSRNTFPALLVNGDIGPGDTFKQYSYAFYVDGKLVNQIGKYAYQLSNSGFKASVKNYTIQNTPLADKRWYKPLAYYNHLIYRPTKRYMIVVSREDDPIEQVVTSLTFFFVTLLTFSTIVFFVSWVWGRVRIFNIRNKKITLGFKINVDKVLYRSRIQFSLVFTVVCTLFVIGVITFHSISNQYKDQQDGLIRDEINHIREVFQTGILNDYYSTTEEGQVRFNEFASTYQVDLTLFNIDGEPLMTTQPKIYDYNLQARHMNGRAFISLSKLRQSVFLNDEKIGDLSYKAAYIPTADKHGNTAAYLQLPYFSNEIDYNERIGPLLNAMINVYALVFIAIGLFAVIIARQITSPLSFIQHNISNTIYGQKNEPIVWGRDDEIGALVKEYNKMIAELEGSAQRLAQSERESAWREMAKQVAHEIKNPLTPLKLGLQLLEKSWRDKDPKFDQKFERFSKSFVEQIESLSSIASEFSAFAKMPDTRLEKVNLFDIIGQAVIIFKQVDNIQINYEQGDPFIIRADRDQLLRCFNNLLKNAIEATPPGRNGVITISHKLTPGHVLLMVADNGNGIPESLRERIFAPNFTTKSSGTGLGLAFVKNSIENAGGKVWFEAGIGKGTTFYLSLPGETA